MKMNVIFDKAPNVLTKKTFNFLDNETSELIDFRFDC